MKLSTLIVMVLTFTTAACARQLPPLSASDRGNVEALLAKMTLAEKVGQLTLLTSDWDKTGPTVREGYVEDIRHGRVGAIFNAYTVEFTRKLQRMAVEETRLGIPLLFGYDVIHGHRTIFPISLAEAASWDLEAIERATRIATREASAEGLHWTFAPMVDIARDPRWGRISEGAGEDVHLGCAIARARVRGIQGSDLRRPDTMLACVKHFAAYGAAQAGRDYHTVDISRQSLWSTYLPPFRAALDEGAASLMTAFNELDGVPATGNDYLLEEVLRNQWQFTGFVVTDYTSINEMVPHGYAKDERHAAELAINAGVDMDMQGATFQKHLVELVTAGKVSRARVDTAARRVLEAKARLGLLDDPYRYCDAQREKEVVETKAHMDFARRFAGQCQVLLKNEGQLLPLSSRFGRLAVVGPLADGRRHMIGSWSAAGDWKKAVTVREGLQARFGAKRVLHAPGCDIEGSSRAGFAKARTVARLADVIVAVLGEGYYQSGEAACRTELTLPGVQADLLKELVATGKPVVLIVMSGRPLALGWAAEHVPAIVQSWFLGTMAGHAVADLLSGECAPSARLPVTVPRTVGQVPIHYDVKNTGRPVDPRRPTEKYRSRYLQTPNSPLWPFGHGLTYTTFAYEDLRSSSAKLAGDDSLEVSVRLRNEGRRAGVEVVQLYLRDHVGSVTRPVRQLIGFQRIALPAGASRRVTFTIAKAELAFWRRDLTFGHEPGDFTVVIGPNAAAGLSAQFSVVD